jgi:molecular chaperone GrpE
MDNNHLNETSSNESSHVNQEFNEASETASELVNESEKLHAEMTALQDKYVRLAADFENFKRNARRDRDELRQTAGKEIIVSLLDVLDDCDRAEKQVQGMDQTLQNNFEGTLLVFNKLRRILEQKGVKPLESMDTEFDVEKHEAITQMDVPDAQKGKVIDELMKGYYLNDKLIRFAKVVVGK